MFVRHLNPGAHYDLCAGSPILNIATELRRESRMESHLKIRPRSFLRFAAPVDYADESITLSDLRTRWEWDPLRNDPRFQKILGRIETEDNS
jgi:hypothetical protein